MFGINTNALMALLKAKTAAKYGKHPSDMQRPRHVPSGRGSLPSPNYDEGAMKKRVLDLEQQKIDQLAQAEARRGDLEKARLDALTQGQRDILSMDEKKHAADVRLKEWAAKALYNPVIATHEAEMALGQKKDGGVDSKQFRVEYDASGQPIYTNKPKGIGDTSTSKEGMDIKELVEDEELMRQQSGYDSYFIAGSGLSGRLGIGGGLTGSGGDRSIPTMNIGKNNYLDRGLADRLKEYIKKEEEEKQKTDGVENIYKDIWENIYKDKHNLEQPAWYKDEESFYVSDEEKQLPLGWETALANMREKLGVEPITLDDIGEALKSGLPGYTYSKNPEGARQFMREAIGNKLKQSLPDVTKSSSSDNSAAQSDSEVSRANAEQPIVAEGKQTQRYNPYDLKRQIFDKAITDVVNAESERAATPAPTSPPSAATIREAAQRDYVPIVKSLAESFLPKDRDATGLEVKAAYDRAGKIVTIAKIYGEHKGGILDEATKQRALDVSPATKEEALAQALLLAKMKQRETKEKPDLAGIAKIMELTGGAQASPEDIKKMQKSFFDLYSAIYGK